MMLVHGQVLVSDLCPFQGGKWIIRQDRKCRKLAAASQKEDPFWLCLP